MQLVYAFILMVASYLISASMQKKPEDPKPATINDFDFPQFEEGTPQMVVFGDCWIPDFTVLTYSDFRTQTVRSGGGKK